MNIADTIDGARRAFEIAGRGLGHEKAGGGGLVLELASAQKGWFVPFDTVRIQQERPAGEGRVQETVELLSKKKGREVPFMKIEEEGFVYRPVLLPGNPPGP